MVDVKNRALSQMWSFEQAKPLFVAGCPRSGTSAFTEYLNLHPEILVCMERYGRVPADVVSPELFEFERILDYSKEDTVMPREYHAELLARKEPEKLKWIGDKYPGYTRWLKKLARNNPEAHFIVLYRPVEEVAESWEAKSKNPDDPWLGGKNGFELGVDTWNKMQNRVRESVERGLDSKTLIMSYHDFFDRNEDCLRLIGRFLGLKFDESVREAWGEMSQEFETKRRPKRAPTEEQEELLLQKDHEVEEWLLERIEQQWKDLELYEAEREELVRSMNGEPYRLADALLQSRAESEDHAANARTLKQRIEKLEHRLENKSTNVERLKRRNKRLENKIWSLNRETDAPVSLLRGLRTRLASLSTRIFGFRQR